MWSIYIYNSFFLLTRTILTSFKSWLKVTKTLTYITRVVFQERLSYHLSLHYRSKNKVLWYAPSFYNGERIFKKSAAQGHNILILEIVRALCYGDIFTGRNKELYDCSRGNKKLLNCRNVKSNYFKGFSMH